jgi:hypothetical protein
MFHLMGLRAEVTVGEAARLSGLTASETESLLRELLSVHLIDEPAPGRYRMHDLLRLFAREC